MNKKVINNDDSFDLFMTRFLSMYNLTELCAEYFDVIPEVGHTYKITTEEDDTFEIIIDPKSNRFKWGSKIYDISFSDFSFKLGNHESNNIRSITGIFADLAQVIAHCENFTVEDSCEGEETVTRNVFLDDLFKAATALKIGDDINLDFNELD